MIRRSLLMLGAALCLSGVASAVKLPSKTADVIDIDMNTLQTAGRGMLPRSSGGGQIVRKAITKIPGKIPWGGVVTIAPLLISEGLQYFYDELKRQTNTPLDTWWESESQGFPSPREAVVNNTNYIPDQSPIICQGYSNSGVKYTYWVGKSEDGAKWRGMVAYTLSNGSVYAGGGTALWDNRAQVVKDLTDPNSYCAQLKGTQTLDQLLEANPSLGPVVSNITRDYIRAKPDSSTVRQMFSTPLPTVNQWEDALIDPSIISVPNSRYSDGDYLQEGLEPTPGNRPHPLDGGPVEPWPDSPQPQDTDGDGIPDWRDSDDDGDSVPDDKEDTDTQKDPTKKPESATDTDGDGIPDDQDGDDDGDGWSDVDEERNGTDPKSPASKPADNDGDGISDKDDPDDDNDGATDAEEEAAGTNSKDPSSKPKEEPIKCQPGQVPSEDNKSCVPEKDPPKCPEGQKPDSSTPPKCVPDTDPKDPVDDECGDMSIPRMMAHTKNWVRDWVVPCDALGDIFKPLMDKASGRYPFAMVTAFNSGVVKVPGSGDRAAALPDKLGPFTLDWAWLTPLITIVGLLFKGATSWIAVDLVLSRLMGQVVVK